jgi:hypothetical protein
MDRLLFTFGAYLIAPYLWADLWAHKSMYDHKSGFLDSLVRQDRGHSDDHWEVSIESVTSL